MPNWGTNTDPAATRGNQVPDYTAQQTTGFERQATQGGYRGQQQVARQNFGGYQQQYPPQPGGFVDRFGDREGVTMVTGEAGPQGAAQGRYRGTGMDTMVDTMLENPDRRIGAIATQNKNQAFPRIDLSGRNQRPYQRQNTAGFGTGQTGQYQTTRQQTGGYQQPTQGQNTRYQTQYGEDQTARQNQNFPVGIGQYQTQRQNTQAGQAGLETQYPEVDENGNDITNTHDLNSEEPTNPRPQTNKFEKQRQRQQLKQEREMLQAGLLANNPVEEPLGTNTPDYEYDDDSNDSFSSYSSDSSSDSSYYSDSESTEMSSESSYSSSILIPSAPLSADYSSIHGYVFNKFLNGGSSFSSDIISSWFSDSYDATDSGGGDEDGGKTNKGYGGGQTKDGNQGKNKNKMPVSYTQTKRVYYLVKWIEIRSKCN